MKIKFYFYLAVVFFASPVFAESSLSAHLHGHVQFNVAADGNTLFVEVHSPSQSFLGFEHRPHTEKQKNLWSSVKSQWEKKISKLIQIDPFLECKVTQAQMNINFEKEKEHHHHDEEKKVHAEESHDENEHHSHDEHKPLKGEHSEIYADATFVCTKEIKDSQMIVMLKKHFPKIEEIEAQVLPNSGTPYSKILTKNKAILNF